VKRSHESRNVYRTRDEMRSLREAVLDAWAAGDDGSAIAKRFWIERGYMDAIVVRARRIGDHRAARRYASGADRERTLRRHDPARMAVSAERRELIRAMRPMVSARSISAILGVGETTVYKALTDL
jgi:hypothetical protein